MKKIFLILFLFVGLASSVNYLPESALRANASLSMDSTYPGDIEMWGGAINNWTGGDREKMANYDLIIKAIGTDLYAIHANGTVLSTGTTSNCGAVWNEGVDAIRSGSIGKMTVFVDAPVLVTTETMYLYSYMRVFGVGGGLPAIYVATDIPILKCNDTGGSGNNAEIFLQDLYLEYTGKNIYTSGHVELWAPNQCTVSRVATRTPNIIGNSSLNRGGIRLLSTANPGTVYSWLNRIIDCPCTGIEFENVSDSWVVRCDVYNGLHSDYAIRIGNNSNSLKFLYNHIIAQNDAGIAFTASNSNSILVGNYFEPIMAVTAGLQEYGIYFDSSGTYQYIDISNNVMAGLGGVALYLSNVRDSTVRGNRIYSCNRNYLNGLAFIYLREDTANKCRSNIVSDNILRDDWNEATSNLGIMEYNGAEDPNENLIHGNIVRGGAFDSPGISLVGTDSKNYDNVVLYTWDP